LRWLLDRHGILIHISAAVAVAMIIGLTTYSSYTIISDKTWRVSSKDEAWLDDWIETVRLAADYVPAGKRLLMDNTALNYYLDNQAIILYTRPTWDVIQAKDKERARQALDELSVGGLVLVDKLIPGYWDQAPFFQYYSDPGNAVFFASENGYSTYLLIGPPYSTSSDVFLSLIDRLDVASKVSLDNDAYIKRSAFVVDLEPKRVLYMHPSARVSFQIEIPTEAGLSFFPMLAPEVHRIGMGDGVQFSVSVHDGLADYEVFSVYSDPKNFPDQRHWLEQTVDMGHWAGRTVTVTFETGSGPNGDDRYDWAGWGEPRLLRIGGRDLPVAVPETEAGRD
jgi:hypothetical protein